MTLTATPAQPEATVTGNGDSLAGVGTLVRFNLRRDRIRIPVWIGALVMLTVSTAAGFPDLYQTAQERQARASLMDSPAARAMSGPGFGLDDYTFGAMLANEMTGFLAIFVALMTVLMVARHTRNEEETGRAELVRAGVVGRHAHLTAALVVAVLTNVLLAAVLVVGIGGLGVETIGWTGTFAFGASLAAVGIVFAGIAAVTAQVFEHGRSASGIAGAAIGVAFALRAGGDMGTAALSWLSPIGWAQQTRAYVDERWWPLLMALAVAVAAIAAAYWLSGKRDVGSGLKQPRPGAATGSQALTTPLGFALRLHRGGLIGWSVALLLFGGMYGSLAAQVEQFVEESPQLQEFVAQIPGGSFLDSWLSMIMSMLATVVAIFGILAVVRLRSEETTGRAEPVLATSLTRIIWAGTHLVVALAGGVVVMLAAALGLGLSAAASTKDASLVGELIGAALVYVPAVWLATGLAFALFGLLPRAVHLAWVVLVYGLVISMLGGLLQLPGWMQDLSPFGQVPQLPGAEFEAGGMLVLTAIAVVLIAAGLAGIRRRDLAST